MKFIVSSKHRPQHRGYGHNPALDDRYYLIAHDWQRKAEALQARRWKALRAQEGGKETE